LKIGIYINQSSSAGGGFYEAIGSTKNFEGSGLEYEYFSSNRDSFNFLKKSGVHVNFIRLRHIDRFFLFLRRSILNFVAKLIPGNVIPVKILSKIFRKYNRFEKKFINSGIDLVYFSSPEPNAVYLENLNFIITVWDLAHRELPFFPELRKSLCFEARDHFYKSVLPKAYAIIVGHELAREQLKYFYNQRSEKIFVIPFRPSLKIVEFEAKFLHSDKIARPEELPAEYIYYPAQYSAHKSHASLINAIYILNKKRHLKVSLVFTGGDKGNLLFLKSKVQELGLQKYVKFLPFQTDFEVYRIFKNAKAMVMPSFIGPGTLPTLEAMYLKIPFLVPDFASFRKYYANSCIYFDIFDEQDLANKIEFLLASKKTVSSLVDAATYKYEEIRDNSEIDLLNSHLKNFKYYLESYK